MTAVRIAASELDQHRPYLLKFAMLQLRQREVAEDLVQEVFVAALKSADSFAGKSSVRTWLTSILLHKITDHRRRAGREISIEAQQALDGADSIEALFQANGRHIDMPLEWRNPEETLTDRRFFAVLEACVKGLSERNWASRRPIVQCCCTGHEFGCAPAWKTGGSPPATNGESTMIMMPSCKETSVLLSDQLDRKLRPMERIGLRLHLAMCKACARVEGQLGFLRSALSALPHSDDESTPAKE